MKKVKALLAAIAVAGLVSGCALIRPTGVLLTDVTLPMHVGSYSDSSKVGVAECKSICNLVVTGDASIQAACKKAGIKKIHHVDWKVNSLLGIISTYTCTVYGD